MGGWILRACFGLCDWVGLGRWGRVGVSYVDNRVVDIMGLRREGRCKNIVRVIGAGRVSGYEKGKRWKV